METLTALTVDLAELIEATGNPMEEDIWGCGPINLMDVMSCSDISIGRLPAGLTAESTNSLEYNIARIAWLANNYDFEDIEDAEPISIASAHSITSGAWPILDGNHRVCAALIAGVKNIAVEVEGEIWW